VGVVDSFWFTAIAASVSGVGVAAYHPAGAGRAREISDGEHVLMSWFSLGGNLGFALAPLVVAETIGALGLRASPLLLIPRPVAGRFIALASVVLYALPALAWIMLVGLRDP